MTDRRTFLQAGLVAGVALPTIKSSPLLAATARLIAGEPHDVLIDTRFPESIAFGKEAQRLGHRIHAFAGDITPYWLDNLHQSGSENPVRIAGMTTHGPLFCLEQLLVNRVNAVGFKAWHRAAGSRTVHDIHSPEPLRDVPRVTPDGPEWARRFAQIALVGIGGLPALAGAPAAAASDLAKIGPLEDALVSWVIAPRRRG